MIINMIINVSLSLSLYIYIERERERHIAGHALHRFKRKSQCSLDAVRVSRSILGGWPTSRLAIWLPRSLASWLFCVPCLPQPMSAAACAEQPRRAKHSSKHLSHRPQCSKVLALAPTLLNPFPKEATPLPSPACCEVRTQRARFLQDCHGLAFPRQPPSSAFVSSDACHTGLATLEAAFALLWASLFDHLVDLASGHVMQCGCLAAWLPGCLAARLPLLGLAVYLVSCLAVQLPRCPATSLSGCPAAPLPGCHALSSACKGCLAAWLVGGAFS